MTCDNATAIARMKEVDGYLETVNNDYKEEKARLGSKPTGDYALAFIKLYAAFLNTVYIPWKHNYNAALAKVGNMLETFDCPGNMQQAEHYQGEGNKYSKQLAHLSGKRPTATQPDKPKEAPPSSLENAANSVSSGLKLFGMGAMALAVVYALRR